MSSTIWRSLCPEGDELIGCTWKTLLSVAIPPMPSPYISIIPWPLLIYWGLNKTVDHLQTTFWNKFLKEKLWIYIIIFSIFVSSGQILSFYKIYIYMEYQLSVQFCDYKTAFWLCKPLVCMDPADHYNIRNSSKINEKSNFNQNSVHYSDVIIGAMAFQIASLTIVYSTIYSGADQRKYQSSASLAFVRGIHRWSVNSPHKEPVTRKMFPSDDVIMEMPLSHCFQFRCAIILEFWYWGNLWNITAIKLLRNYQYTGQNS